MAARAIVPLTTPSIIRDIEDMARSGSDTAEILKAIAQVDKSVAGMRAELSGISKAVDILIDKTDRLERDKAAIGMLTELEVRWKETFQEARLRTERDLSQKIGKEQFSVDSFDNFSMRLEEVDKRTQTLVSNRESDHELLQAVAKSVSDLNSVKDKAAGAKWAIGAISGGAGAILLWLLQHYLPK